MKTIDQQTLWIEEARRFADVLDLDFHIDANSWWYPGSTTRLIFRQRKG